MRAPIVTDHGTPPVQAQLAADVLNDAHRRLQRIVRRSSRIRPAEPRCQGLPATTTGQGDASRSWRELGLQEAHDAGRHEMGVLTG